ncbi:MAG: hypothetical protein ACFHU9_17260 [Fluviicola sp.]
MVYKTILHVSIITFSLFGCSEEASDYTTNQEISEAQDGDESEDSLKVEKIPVITEPYCIHPTQKITDRKLLAFQEKLNIAILQKDTSLLLSLMDSNVVTSYGGAMYGYEDFLLNWETGGLWKKLKLVTELGGEYEADTSFRYPFFTVGKNYRAYENYDIIHPDPYFEFYAMKDTVMLFEDISSTNAIAKLVGCYLYFDYNKSKRRDDGWLELTTYQKNIRGFVKSEDVFRTGDYNLIVEKDSLGNWRITSFAPYD